MLAWLRVRKNAVCHLHQTHVKHADYIHIHHRDSRETVVQCPRSLLTLRNQNHFVCDDNDAYSDVRLGRTVHSVEFADTC